MYKPIIRNNQSFIDLTLQFCGSMDYLVNYAYQNDICITSSMIAGSELGMAMDKNKATTHYYTAYDIVPATGLTDIDQELVDSLGEDPTNGIFDNTFDNTYE